MAGDSAPAPVTRSQALQTDIDFLVSRMQAIHPDLFHSIIETDFRAAAMALKSDIPVLTDNEIFVEIKRLVALAASQEDGHAGVTMFQATNFHAFPLRLYAFSDGAFVIDATPDYRDAIGKRVVQIGGMDMEAVDALIDPLITRDNETTVLLKKTLYYIVPEILHTLGILDRVEQGEYALEDADGNRSVLTLSPVSPEVYAASIGQSIGLFEQPSPLYLSDLTERFWMQSRPETKALYIKYNHVQADTQSGVTLAAFSDQIANTVANQGIEKVIVDVRQNGGGNAFTFEPLINVLSSPAIDQPSRLYVLIGRLTFSAAANFVTVLEQRATHVEFVGEPTGGSLNNYGDVTMFDLPHSGYEIAVPPCTGICASDHDSPLPRTCRFF